MPLLNIEASTLTRKLMHLDTAPCTCNMFLLFPPQGTIVVHSLTGGTGSGLGSRLVERIRDTYPLAHVMSVAVSPHSSGDSPLQHYNSLLSLSSLQQWVHWCYYKTGYCQTLMQDRHFRFGLRNSYDSAINLTLDWAVWVQVLAGVTVGRHITLTVSQWIAANFNAGDYLAMDKNPVQDERGAKKYS